ncbi:hypothetical protein BDF19DRAFT_3530 [Syncephalis fuscata]|nr:hypothetical protein BDF19DRAFT_3530 [Syncephalis fuscata]
MTSVYRINYQLRAHKRDALIEFIKSMMLTPFVLHIKPHAIPGSLADQDNQVVSSLEGGEGTGFVSTALLSSDGSLTVSPTATTTRQRRLSDAERLM